MLRFSRGDGQQGVADQVQMCRGPEGVVQIRCSVVGAEVQEVAEVQSKRC